MPTSINRLELEQWLTETLLPTNFRDYCPNGLQVQGKDKISKIITGVTASQALIEVAIAQQADAILVHHGWFWKNEDPCIKGMKHQRLSSVLANDINLFAYHLPLDAHPEWGNNAQLAKIMDWAPSINPDGTPKNCGPENLIWLGQPAWEDCTLGELSTDIAQRLDRKPLVIGDLDKKIRSIAWCTGAAQSMFDAAIAAGADCYISGEISEPTVHMARESGIAYISAGHHATERYGVQALGAAIEAQFGISCTFVDINNPV